MRCKRKLLEAGVMIEASDLFTPMNKLGFKQDSPHA